MGTRPMWRMLSFLVLFVFVGSALVFATGQAEEE